MTRKEATPTPVSVYPFAERRAPSVNKITVPLPLTITAILFVAGLMFTAAMTWSSVVNHANAAEKHLNVVEVTRGGGLAYRGDVLQLRYETEKGMRKAIKSAVITCRQSSPETFTCGIDLPEQP